MIKRAASAALAASLFCACLDPVVDPETAYDPNVVLKNEPFRTFDYIQVSLLDEGAPGRRSLIWNGDPDTLSRFPVQKTREGESVSLELRGYKHPKGHCFTARFLDSGRIVDLDDCGP